MKHVTFIIPAYLVEPANSAYVLGEFNNWTPSEHSKMTLQEDGSLAVTLPLEIGKNYQYRFFLNDGRWLNDPAAQGYQEQVNYFTANSIVFVEEDIVNEAVENTEDKSEPKKAVAKKNTEKKANGKKTAAKKTAANDPLEKIKGINVATRNVLHKAGITTFSKLSKTGQATIKAALSAAGENFAAIDSSSWVREAKKMAAEKAASLKN